MRFTRGLTGAILEIPPQLCIVERRAESNLGACRPDCMRSLAKALSVRQGWLNDKGWTPVGVVAEERRQLLPVEVTVTSLSRLMKQVGHSSTL